MKPIRSHTGKFREMQLLVRLAKLKERDPALYDQIMEEQIGGRERKIDESRRSFLKGAAGAAAGAIGLEALESFSKKAYGAPTQVVNVAVVGSGVAGLNCAWHLRKFIPALSSRGIQLNVTIYEGRPNRTGGRMLTSTDDVASNMRCELGGEFVDSSNDDIFRLAQDPELNEVCLKNFGHPLAMIDTGQDHVTNKLIPQTLFIQGKPHRLEDALEKIGTFIRATAETPVKEINAACDKFQKESGKDPLTGEHVTSCGGTGSLGFNNYGERSGALSNALLTRFDKMTTEQYINSLPIKGDDGWVKGYLQTAYTTEYGMGLDEQSALGMVTLFGDQEEVEHPTRKTRKSLVTGRGGAKKTSSEPASDVEVFGSSDERFKVLGGNDKIVRTLTIALQTLGPRPAKILLDTRLKAVNRGPNGTDTKYTLVFENSRGVSAEVRGVDLVVMACPFTGLSTIPKPSDPSEWLKHPRFARLNPQHPMYQPFADPADLSTLGIQKEKADAIDTVGYGRNFKIMAGFDKQVWRDQKDAQGNSVAFGGYTFSDEPFQMGWDSGECQNLDVIPTAIQNIVGLSRPGVFPTTRVEKKNFGSVPNTAFPMVNNRLFSPAKSAKTDGAQFSWFLGGGSLSEGLLKDPQMRNFVSHTMGNGVPGEGALVANQPDGRGVTRPQYARIQQYVDFLVKDVGKVYTDFVASNARQNAKLGRQASSSYVWTNDHFTRGSYLAYLPGQWTNISGVEGAPLTMDGKLANFPEAAKWTMFFCGEHCAGDFQGFMNGGAQTGRLAAQRILIKFLGLEAAKLVPGGETEMTKLIEPTRRRFFVKGFDEIFS